MCVTECRQHQLLGGPVMRLSLPTVVRRSHPAASMKIPAALQRLGHAAEQRGQVLEALGDQVAHHGGGLA